MRRNSITPSRQSLTNGVPVRRCSPGAALVKHAMAGLGTQLILARPVAGSTTGCFVAGSSAGVPISTRHMRQLPAMLSLGW